MRLLNGEIRLSASDLANHLACKHLTSMNVDELRGKIKRPDWRDPALEALRRRGLEHERAYLEHLRGQGMSISELSSDPKVTRPVDAMQQTFNAMRDGADIIYQATLTTNNWLGYADFLKRVDAPSDLGDYSYEVIDTKLSRETKGGAILQLSLYSDIIGGTQGTAPKHMYIVKPGTEFAAEPYRLRDYQAYYRFVRGRLEEVVAKQSDENDNTYPDPCPHCDICRWWKVCDSRRRADDHLCLVAGISKMQTRELQERNVGTLEVLADTVLPLQPRPKHGAPESYERVQDQAAIQRDGRNENKSLHRVINLESYAASTDDDGEDQGDSAVGLARLPLPTEGDVFFDFEGARYVGDGGREYLFGFVTTESGEQEYHQLWGLTAEAEKLAFEQFVDAMTERWRRHPDFHIYHYAPYEPAALKRLMGRHATREEEMDRILRAQRFVDLHSIVKQSIRASVERYSIKDLEPFYGFERPVRLQEATKNLRALESALELGDIAAVTDTIRRTVAGYNEDDCVSAMELRDWLEQIRVEQITRGSEIPRPVIREGDPSEKLDERQQVVRELMERLAADVPAERSERSNEEHARWLLAHMLEWHRREEKAVYWEFFRLRDLTDEELLDERGAVSGLQLDQRLGVKSERSKMKIDRYRFPPQEVRVRKGNEVHSREGKIGKVVAIDTAARTVDIEKMVKRNEIHPTSLFEHDIVQSKTLADSLLRLAKWVADNHINADGDYRAARDLLLRIAPRVAAHRNKSIQRDDETDLDAARRIAVELHGGVLPVQGPPGSGKTYAGARMICDLVRAGKKVGVTGPSHSVIRNLLESVCHAAKELNIDVTLSQKVSDLSDPSDARTESIPITERTDNASVLDDLERGDVQVAAGTAWLWTREEFAATVDVLFIDEAGQISLANALAVAQCARSVVLLGDPQQLEQPQTGSHPDGTQVSVLEHILDGATTMRPDRGLFLGETWRLHPRITSFTSELFYEGRLQSRVGTGHQELIGAHPFTGAGLWYHPVRHTGNTIHSPEEVDQVVALVEQLLSPGSEWRNMAQEAHALTAEDILIVAPYNAQVAALRESLLHLPELLVGTVDKFQGKEAPVVIYSMTSSSPDDTPRGIEFLYSLNRLNVATSRARCACILVASPRLFEPECQTPRQMKLANAFCRYVELCHQITEPGG